MLGSPPLREGERTRSRGSRPSPSRAQVWEAGPPPQFVDATFSVAVGLVYECAVSIVRSKLPTVMLFDIDGTLLHGGGAGRRAFEKALADVCGIEQSLASISFEGMTDYGIARLALLAVKHEPRPESMQALLTRYLVHLPGEVSHSTGFQVLPGVGALLTVLSRHASCAIGLGTGNLREGARIKLMRASLEHWFAFGGFGCDHESRAELVRMGAMRGARHLGRDVSNCRVVVIGDTGRDVEAARAIGADCVGVGTGGWAPAKLLELGAKAAFQDLTDPGVVEAILGAE